MILKLGRSAVIATEGVRDILHTFPPPAWLRFCFVAVFTLSMNVLCHALL